MFKYKALVVLVTAAALLPHCQSFDCTQENVEGIHYRPVNGHCNQFYECIGAVSKHFECAAGNLFDSSLGRCHDEKLVDCYDCDIDENNITYHADRKSCNVYHICTYGTLVRHTCPEKQYYNKDTHECDSNVIPHCITKHGGETVIINVENLIENNLIENNIIQMVTTTSAPTKKHESIWEKFIGDSEHLVNSIFGFLIFKG